MDDGERIREMIGRAAPGQAPRVQLNLQARALPNLKSAIVWGTPSQLNAGDGLAVYEFYAVNQMECE